MGQGDTCIRGAGLRSRDPRHHFERDIVSRQCQRFFAATAENKGVTAFQAHHALALPGQIHQQSIDLILAKGMAVGCLAHVHTRHRVRYQGQDFGRYQPVIDNNVCGLDQTLCFYCKQLRIPRSRSNQIDFFLYFQTMSPEFPAAATHAPPDTAALWAHIGGGFFCCP